MATVFELVSLDDSLGITSAESVTFSLTNVNVTAPPFAWPVNHASASVSYAPRMPFAFTIRELRGAVCATGSGSFIVKRNGSTVATEAFSTTTGGSSDDRALSLEFAADDSLEFQTTGTFTGFRGTVSGTR